MQTIKKGAGQISLIVGLVIVAALVGGFILIHQRLPLPGVKRYEVKAAFATLQAVTPGQGQEVLVAGVHVGDVSKVDVVDGRAVVTMSIEKKKLSSVGRDATLLLRPKTPLQDMSIALDPGKPSDPSIGKAVLPVSQTQPSVNVDEVLSSLDTDTRSYLQIMMASLGRGLDKRGVDLKRVFAASAPTAGELDRLGTTLKGRRADLRQLVSKLRILTGSLADQRESIQRFVGAGDTTFTAIAAEQQPLQRGLADLPPTLTRAQTVIDTVQPLFSKLTRTANAAVPLAKQLDPTLKHLGTFADDTTPTVQELRRLVPKAQPVARQLRTTLARLRPATPAAQPTLNVLRDTVNELSYNPSSPDHGYLFWLAWFGHDVNSMLSTSDANGPLWRSIAVVSCSAVAGLTPAITTAVPVLPLNQVCPTTDGSTK